MKRTITIILCVLVGSLYGWAVDKRPAKSKSDSTYPKLFKDVKKLTKARSLDLSLYLYDDKIYLEIPRRNLGREFMISTHIGQATDMTLLDVMANRPKCIIIDRQDSLLYFKKPRANYVFNATDSTSLRAIGASRMEAPIKSFRIKGFNVDSSRCVIDVTSYFTVSNNDFFNLKGVAYDEGTSIMSSSLKGREFVEEVQGFENAVSIRKSVSVELTLGSMFGALNEKPVSSLSVQFMISVLPEHRIMMHPKEASAHIGSGYVSYHDYSSLNDLKTGYYATKRRFYPGNQIVFYVDTLLSKSWTEAIRQAAEKWNDVFEELRLGRPFVLKPFVADSSFAPNDPMVSVISLANNLSRYVSAYNFTDPRTGEIFSTKITVPRDLASNIRRNGITKMAEADERFRTYYLPDELLCEVLRANMLTAFGRSLGLVQNRAGSHAYSPEQLRSPQFTQKYGISASVMDNVIYNTLAMPGDKERGVVLILDRPGQADAFAVRYLYGNDGKEAFNLLLARHASDPAFLYGKSSIVYGTDPRSQNNDLGNDPVAAAKALVQHLQYTAANSPKWFNMEKLPDSFRSLFQEMSILDLSKEIVVLQNYIGGVYQHEEIKGQQAGLTTTVPRSMQRRCVAAVFDLLSDIGWMDRHRGYLTLGGVANSNINYWYHAQGFAIKSVLRRIKYMDLSILHSDDPYTQIDFLSDIERHVFKPVYENRAPNEYELLDINMYVSSLIQYSPTLTAIEKRQKGEAVMGIADFESGVEPTKSLSYYKQTDLEPIFFEKLTDAPRLLLKAVSFAKGGKEKDKITYILLQADRVLGHS